jgi:hypothetical protein
MMNGSQISKLYPVSDMSPSPPSLPPSSPSPSPKPLLAWLTPLRLLTTTSQPPASLPPTQQALSAPYATANLRFTNLLCHVCRKDTPRMISHINIAWNAVFKNGYPSYYYKM